MTVMFSQAESQTQWFFYTCFRRRLMSFFVHASIRGCHDVKRFYGHKKAPFPSMKYSYKYKFPMDSVAICGGDTNGDSKILFRWKIGDTAWIYSLNTNTQIHLWNTEYKYTDTSMKYRIQIHRYLHEIQNTNTQIHLWNIEYKYTDTSQCKKTKTQTIDSYTNKYDIVREIQTLSQNTQIDGWTDSKEGWVILYVISDTFLKRMYLYLYLYLHMIPFCSACIWRPSWGLKAGPLIQSLSEKQFKISITRK